MKSKILGYAIGPIGSAALGFFTLPLLTWFYSIDNIGRISMLQVVSSLSILLFCLGLDQAYTREYHETSNKPRLFIQSVLPGLLLLIFFFTTVFIFFSEDISVWLYDVPSKYLTFISISCFLFAYASRFLSLILRMEGRAVAYSMSQLLPKVIFFIFIIFSIFLGLDKDVFNLITAHALSIFFAFVVFSWNTRKEWFASFFVRIDKEEQKKLLRFGLPLVIGGLASWGLNVMDKIFLRYMSTFEELGIYSVTMSIAGVASIFSGVFNTIWAPMVYKWSSEGIDINKVNEISDHVLAAVYFILVLSGMFSWVLPYFLPEQYDSIQYLITLCLVGPLLYTLSETTAIGIAITRKTYLSMLASLIAMLVNLIGNYFLVPKYGAFGAAVATSIAFFVFYVLRTEFGSVAWKRIPKMKSYLTVFSIVFVSIAAGFFSDFVYAWLLIWGVFFILGFFLFYKTVFLVFCRFLFF